jgi:4-hydroxy 2-oxovalerate aldolase
MKNIKILDCTLRDGGRIINCDFEDSTITGIMDQLIKANIDIIELGFLRDNIIYNGNSTFFSSLKDAERYINDGMNATKYVVFVDYGLYDVYKLEPANLAGISGIRFGFTRKDLIKDKENLYLAMRHIKKMGYDIYFQDVNTNGYSEEELQELITMANEIKPVSFGIVDTYGSMYLDDLEKIWNVVNERLDQQIMIDFHSHNNMQMSFALTQRLIFLAGKERRLIIDATLNGMGKCAGNLNTELIIDFLSRKYNYDYDLDAVLDAIDRYLYPIKKEKEWGYSIPAFIAGIYKSHPNNVIYLTEKYRLNNRDIKYIISGIDVEKRQVYDYDNIQDLYKNHFSQQIDDVQTLKELRALFEGKSVLVMAPGKTLKTHRNKIIAYVEEHNPIKIAVNFIPEELQYDYLFFANAIRWEKSNNRVDKSKCIVSSNISGKVESLFKVDYTSLIVEDSPLFDNSTIMLLNLLKKIFVKEIQLAGFDGLKPNAENYIDKTFPNEKVEKNNLKTNEEIHKLFMQYREKTDTRINVEFITPSIYQTMS